MCVESEDMLLSICGERMIPYDKMKYSMRVRRQRNRKNAWAKYTYMSYILPYL